MLLPELLMPAGDLKKAYVAFKYGADAIYCGVPMFSLRTRENTFTEENITEIVEFAHKNGKKVYVTVNAFPHQYMMKLFEKHLKFLETVKPDGIIFADFGVLALANEVAPSVEKHLSVQTSTMNVPAINMWKSLGVSRIICAREMAIREVAEIHKLVPDMELEYFVHGAVCMAYSGRCLLSTFNSGRDANCGACNHSCRWNYRVVDEEGRGVDVGDHFANEGNTSTPSVSLPKNGIETSPPNLGGEKERSIRDFEKSNMIEEERRQGQIIPVEEDFHGTHIMSSRDMCMIEYLQDVIDAGVCSLKVEGRNKTIYYLATVARAYRRALNDIAIGKPFDTKLWQEIHATANRGFFPGFLHGKPQSGDIQYEGNQSVSEKEFCGVIQNWKDGRIEISVKNRIDAGNEIAFVFPQMVDDFVIVAADLEFGGKAVEALHGGDVNKIASLKCDREVPVGTLIRQEVRNPGQKKERIREKRRIE